MYQEALTMKKVTLTLDSETLSMLERLSDQRAGNKSYVVREAISRMWEAEKLEGRLEDLEANPDFQTSMALALRQIEEGEVISQKEVERKLAGSRRSRRKTRS